MKIEVLGPGCPNCQKLEKEVFNAISELNLDADVVKVTDIKKIATYGILMTPGLVVNGKVICSGRVPRKEEIKEWLKKAQENKI
jgi:small redox-active disulfide protein 2